MSTPSRDYVKIASQLSPHGNRSEQMKRVVDALWNGLHGTGVSWLGIYLDQPQEPDDRRLVLGPCRDKPACSPIGLHGVCGQALIGKMTRIVRDVSDLGKNYVACDPRDRSEIVVPLFDEGGGCWGVLDLDSWDIGSFDESDAEGLAIALRAAGFIAKK